MSNGLLVQCIFNSQSDRQIRSSCPNVVVFGAINIDLLATAEHQVVADDSTPGKLHRYAGGVGRNIAENLARLDIDTTLVSAVGNDELGRQVLTYTEAAGVNVSAVMVQPEMETASYTAIHNSDGELLHAVSDMHIFDHFLLPDFEIIAPLIESADAIVLDANLPESVLVEISEHSHGKFIVADCVSRQKCKRLNGVLNSLSLLKVNRAEAIALTDCSDESDESLLRDLHKLGPSRLLLSAGSEGVVLSGSAGVNRVSELPQTNVVSTSGAGDAMLSGVVAGELYGIDASQQLLWGTIAAAETVAVHSPCAATISRQLLTQ